MSLSISFILENYQIMIDRDFVFYQEQKNKLYKTWFKNQKGVFLFCGSALLALSQVVLAQSGDEEVKFITESNKTITAKIEPNTGKPQISIELNDSYMKLDHLSWLTQSNVLINKKLSLEELKRIELKDVLEIPNKLPMQSLGAYCCFHQEEEVVHLRYFSPWHGRDEDFATLSIFEYLPLLLKKKKQYIVIQNNSLCFFAQADQKKVVLREK